MIKTINTLFYSQSGDKSNMYLDVVSRYVYYPNDNKIMNIQYRYFLIVDNNKNEQALGMVDLPYFVIQSLIDSVIKEGIINTEGKSNDEILDEAIPYLLIEYMKSKIDEDGKIPFAIPSDDWEIYVKPVVEEIVKKVETLPVTE